VNLAATFYLSHVKNLIDNDEVPITAARLNSNYYNWSAATCVAMHRVSKKVAHHTLRDIFTQG